MDDESLYYSRKDEQREDAKPVSPDYLERPALLVKEPLKEPLTAYSTTNLNTSVTKIPEKIITTPVIKPLSSLSVNTKELVKLVGTTEAKQIVADIKNDIPIKPILANALVSTKVIIQTPISKPVVAAPVVKPVVIAKPASTLAEVLNRVQAAGSPDLSKINLPKAEPLLSKVSLASKSIPVVKPVVAAPVVKPVAAKQVNKPKEIVSTAMKTTKTATVINVKKLEFIEPDKAKEIVDKIKNNTPLDETTTKKLIDENIVGEITVPKDAPDVLQTKKSLGFFDSIIDGITDFIFSFIKK